MVKSYLQQRPQNDVVNGYESDACFAESGVPQVSHLGPVLLLILINDITAKIKHYRKSLCADDLKIYSAVKLPADVALTQNDFNEIISWCHLNCMTLNVKKCFDIKYTRKK